MDWDARADHHRHHYSYNHNHSNVNGDYFSWLALKQHFHPLPSHSQKETFPIADYSPQQLVKENPAVKLDTFEICNGFMFCMQRFYVLSAFGFGKEKCWIVYLFQWVYTLYCKYAPLLLRCIARKFPDQPSIKENIWYPCLGAEESWG